MVGLGIFGAFIFVVATVVTVWIALQTVAPEVTKKAYLAALERLKRDPNNPNLRAEVLALGKKHARLAAMNRVPSVFDEIAIRNQIDAACAKAGSVPEARPSAGTTDFRVKNGTP
jgi:hypothetical protein